MRIIDETVPDETPLNAEEQAELALMIEQGRAIVERARACKTVGDIRALEKFVDSLPDPLPPS